MIPRIALMFLGFVAMCGCVTHDWTAKAASGRVVDAASGTAMSGVAIYRVLDDKSVFVGATDSHGRFAIPAAGRMFATVPMPGDPAYLSFLVFRAPGYRDEKVDCGTITGEVVAHEAPSLPPLTVKLRKGPNHAMDRTADRRTLQFEMASTLLFRAMRGLVRRRSSCSR